MSPRFVLYLIVLFLFATTAMTRKPCISVLLPKKKKKINSFWLHKIFVIKPQPTQLHLSIFLCLKYSSFKPQKKCYHFIVHEPCHSTSQHFVHTSIIRYISPYYDCLLTCVFLPLNYNVLEKRILAYILFCWCWASFQAHK